MDNVNFQSLTEEQIKFLEDELLAYEKNPVDGSTWEEIKGKMNKEK